MHRNRRMRPNAAKRYALPVFVLISILVGFTVFGIFSMCQSGDENNSEDSSTSPNTSDTSVLPSSVQPPTFSGEDSWVSDDSDHDSREEKQPAPSCVTYASANSSTVSLGDEADCESVILIDISENCIVASKDDQKRVFPASLTKVMALITAYDYINDPYTEYFTMTQEILEPLIASGNSLAGFEVGENAPLIDYLHGMIMFSGADATEAVATYCCGSVDAFVDAMNRKAAGIGLKNSHFTNPVGTHDDDHYSTVHDLALILGYAYECDALADILNKYKYTTSPTDIHPDGLDFESNLEQRMKGDESGTCEVLGGKTGFTNDAGHCVLAYAVSNKTGKEYLFAATGGKAMYDPIWDCINTLKDHVE